MTTVIAVFIKHFVCQMFVGLMPVGQGPFGQNGSRSNDIRSKDMEPSLGTFFETISFLLCFNDADDKFYGFKRFLPFPSSMKGAATLGTTAFGITTLFITTKTRHLA